MATRRPNYCNLKENVLEPKSSINPTGSAAMFLELEDFGNQERRGEAILTSFHCVRVTDSSQEIVVDALAALRQRARVTWNRASWRTYDVLAFTDDLEMVAESFRALSERLREHGTWAASTLLHETDSFLEAVDIMGGETSLQKNLGSFYREKTVRIAEGEIKNGTVVLLDSYLAPASSGHSTLHFGYWSERYPSLLFTWVDAEMPWNWASVIPTNQGAPAFAVFNRLGSQVHEFLPMPDEEAFLTQLKPYA